MDLSRFPTLRQAWQSSVATLEKINARLIEAIDTPGVGVVVAGSFGRLEASELSDLDFMILSQDDLGEAVPDIVTVIRRIASDLKVNLPNPEGVFSTTLSINKLINQMGGAEDTLESLAQRMLLLMESRPIYNEEIYRKAIHQVLSKYLDLVIEDPRKDPLVLINDVIRYFRSICVNYHFNFWRQQEKWGLRNVKLKHSRIVLYAGLLFLALHATNQRAGKFEYIIENIPLTPLEKLAHVFAENEDFSFDRILGPYEVFLRRMCDERVREALKIDYNLRYSSSHYIDLKVNAEALQSELVRFLLSPHRQWFERAIGLLVF